MGKVCTGCAREIPATTEYFHKHAPAKDGLKPRCKGCQCSAESSRYLSKGEAERSAYIARVSQWRQKNRTRVAATGTRWESANPEKRRSQWTVANAVRDGKLFKQPCEVCGSANVQAHHDDYSLPLNVRWLCTKHHAVADRARRASERMAS